MKEYELCRMVEVAGASGDLPSKGETEVRAGILTPRLILKC